MLVQNIGMFYLRVLSLCTLTIPTICTTDTMTKVVGRIKQWCDFLANNSNCGYSPRPHKTPSSTPPFPSSAINPTVVCHQPGNRCCPHHCPHHYPCCCLPSSPVNSHHGYPGHHPPPPPLQSATTLQHEQAVAVGVTVAVAVVVVLAVALRRVRARARARARVRARAVAVAVAMAMHWR